MERWLIPLLTPLLAAVFIVVVAGGLGGIFTLTGENGAIRNRAGTCARRPLSWLVSGAPIDGGRISLAPSSTSSGQLDFSISSW